MNVYLLLAAILCILLGMAHSVLGELLIFKDKRTKRSIIPGKSGQDLKGRHLRILWATWHLVSIFGWVIAAIVIKLSLVQDQSMVSFSTDILIWITCTMFIASFLVLIATNGKHPGWIVLSLIGSLILLGID